MLYTGAAIYRPDGFLQLPLFSYVPMFLGVTEAEGKVKKLSISRVVYLTLFTAISDSSHQSNARNLYTHVQERRDKRRIVFVISSPYNVWRWLYDKRKCLRVVEEVK